MVGRPRSVRPIPLADLESRVVEDKHRQADKHRHRHRPIGTRPAQSPHSRTCCFSLCAGPGQPDARCQPPVHHRGLLPRSAPWPAPPRPSPQHSPPGPRRARPEARPAEEAGRAANARWRRRPLVLESCPCSRNPAPADDDKKRPSCPNQEEEKTNCCRRSNCCCAEAAHNRLLQPEYS